ncbi:lysozyme inhibitor LprI family protein [Pseudomonas ovata]|uniref:lysozyme inhibitor LprI family protein n=1 Tax=Pseudomonas ovata TaxID=1839709 RepID=UPI001F4DFDFD|nr:lysozyme inhibitor LprI family protein [Pseudomonas ovata]
MMRYLPALCTALFCLSASAKDQYSAQYDACVARSEGITFNMNECDNKELAKQNARLNTAYKAAMAALSDEQKTQLRDAQRLWIKYRDANCFMYYHFSGGTMDQINGAGCELSMTVKRSEELKWFAEMSE